MEKENGNIFGLPPSQAVVVAVVADGVIIAFSLNELRSAPIEALPFVVFGTACLVSTLNLTLILLCQRLQRPLLRALGSIAAVGNVGLLLVLGLVGAFGLILLGGGGNAFGAQLQLMALGAAIAATLVLNMALIQRACVAGRT
jgi:hypothetical protein